MKRFALAVAVVVIGWTSNAAAFTVGASYLSNNADFSSAVSDFSTDAGGYKIFLGFDFIKFFGGELSYRDLGNYNETSGSSSIDASIKAYDASVRGILPLGKLFSIFAKAGYSNISTSGFFDGTVVDESDWKLFYGVGVDLNLGEHMGVRTEWEQYDVDQSLNSLSLGAFFRF